MFDAIDVLEAVEAGLGLQGAPACAPRPRVDLRRDSPETFFASFLATVGPLTNCNAFFVSSYSKNTNHLKSWSTHVRWALVPEPSSADPNPGPCAEGRGANNARPRRPERRPWDRAIL